MSFQVIASGALSLLQDLGRFGYQQSGLTTGGPMDEHAFCWGNWLLSNPINTTALEVTLGQLKLVATEATTIALTGADLQATLNKTPLSPWCTYAIHPGDQLNFGYARSGLRAYLAVVGGFQCPQILGSTATVIREGIGGLTGTGAALQENDVLDYTAHVDFQARRVPRWARLDYHRPMVLDVIETCQFDWFDTESREMFYHSDYQISPQCDRMGYRLSGPPLAPKQGNLTSEGIMPGSIQIPQDGQPIVLMRDRQTIGGYPKIGCLTRMSVSRLAQGMPGQSVRFRPINIDVAEAEFRLFQQVLHAYPPTQRDALQDEQ